MTKIGYEQTEEHRKKISISMRKVVRSDEHRANIAVSKLGEKNGMWKENAGYSAVHAWIRTHFIKPKNCEHCGEEKKLDWASKTKEYKKNIEEYVALCRSCHIKLDRYGSIQV